MQWPALSNLSSVSASVNLQYQHITPFLMVISILLLRLVAGALEQTVNVPQSALSPEQLPETT
jgi:hypothetical protein